MEIKIALGMIIPFLGTLIGSALVFILRKDPSVLIKKILIGFAAGVMVAASIWSLIIPGIEKVSMGKFSFSKLRSILLSPAITFSAGKSFLVTAA